MLVTGLQILLSAQSKLHLPVLSILNNYEKQHSSVDSKNWELMM